ncbi:hypothetical protein A3D72_04240 [Candidatus Uhrbacteria bacterium RIFCSPHIGHO2_02_FULL_57_19]|nr:MAG: hypothetical protein A3D72_04240 [Candidatus Uhrbacteria bacterium RIFCSPHIGHO2_02_FULL_57_19]
MGADLVIHAAAAFPTHGTAKFIYSVNVGGTENVLEAARTAGVRRVIFISSTTVYGLQEGRGQKEETFFAPIDPYAETKIIGERLFLDAWKKHHLETVILRPKTIIGPGRLGAFQILFEWIANSGAVFILGDGKNVIQLLAVEDFVSAIVLGSRAPCSGEIFHFGTNQYRTVREDLSDLIGHAGTSSRLVFIPRVPAEAILSVLYGLRLSPLAAWQYKSASQDATVNTDKAKLMFSWTPRFSNFLTMRNNYDWYVRNRTELKKKRGNTHRDVWNLKLMKILEWIS